MPNAAIIDATITAITCECGGRMILVTAYGSDRNYPHAQELICGTCLRKAQHANEELPPYGPAHDEAHYRRWKTMRLY